MLRISTLSNIVFMNSSNVSLKDILVYKLYYKLA